MNETGKASLMSRIIIDNRSYYVFPKCVSLHLGPFGETL